jgi:hypothetical protein
VKAFFLILTSIIILCSPCFAASNKEDYELQERCGKRSAELFKEHYGNGTSNNEDDQMISVYTNHYNKKLNKCFMLVTTTTFPKKKGNIPLIMKNIWDINENKEYASFDRNRNLPTPITCTVLDKICSSENQWDLLVKPYMED